MSRDYRKLRVFQLADDLVVHIYRATRAFPPEERYGLRSQIRRAAVSTVANLVEGSGRVSTREYARFVDISVGSASEADYLLDLAGRLGLLPANDRQAVKTRSVNLLRQLRKLRAALDHLEP